MHANPPNVLWPVPFEPSQCIGGRPMISICHRWSYPPAARLPGLPRTPTALWQLFPGSCDWQSFKFLLGTCYGPSPLPSAPGSSQNIRRTVRFLWKLDRWTHMTQTFNERLGPAWMLGQSENFPSLYGWQCGSFLLWQKNNHDENNNSRRTWNPGGSLISQSSRIFNVLQPWKVSSAPLACASCTSAWEPSSQRPHTPVVTMF